MKGTQQSPGKPSQRGPMAAYEELMEFNQHCRGALDQIEGFGQRQMIPRAEYRYYRALLDELRASVSQSVMEVLDQQEITAAARASRERLHLEKRLLK